MDYKGEWEKGALDTPGPLNEKIEYPCISCKRGKALLYPPTYTPFYRRLLDRYLKTT
jgi:hypothetical protein